MGLDERHRLAEISGTERGRIAPWTGAEDDDVDAVRTAHNRIFRMSASTSPSQGREARGKGTVDHAVVVGERERKHEARNELTIAPHGFHPSAREAEDADLGGVDDRREGRSADAAEARDRERRTLDIGRTQLSRASSVSELGQLACDLEDPLLIDVTNHWYDQAVRGVDGDAEMRITLEHETLARVFE